MPNPFQNAKASTESEAPAAGTFQRPASSDKPAAKSKDPFARPTGGGDQTKITEDLGSLLVVRLKGIERDFQTAYGPCDTAEADWIVCDGENAGETRTDGRIFNRPLVKDLAKLQPGGLLVGRLMKGTAKTGQSEPFIFQDFDEEEEELARQCAESVGWI